MKRLSLKEFIEQLTVRLDRLGHEELKEYILEYAHSLPPDQRAAYLGSFTPPGKKQKDRVGTPDGESLLKEIEAFGELVENYEYTTGWGWDHEIGAERAWGDENWTFELDGFFDGIEALYDSGAYFPARNAYQNLLHIYHRGIEEGQLSGHDHAAMIDTDVEEATLKYLRCVYLTEEPRARPAVLFREIRSLYWHCSSLNLRGIINAGVEDLPRLDGFGKAWISYLKGHGDDRIATELLKEAVHLFEGPEGLEGLAKMQGKQFPGAFVEWLNALDKEERHEEMIGAASLGLETLSESLSIRATIADYLRHAANRLNREDLVEWGLKEGLWASPSLPRLLDLLEHKSHGARRRELMTEALARFGAIRERVSKAESPSVRLIRSWDFNENHVPDNLELYCHLMMGEYAPVSSVMVKALKNTNVSAPSES